MCSLTAAVELVLLLRVDLQLLVTFAMLLVFFPVLTITKSWCCFLFLIIPVEMTSGITSSRITSKAVDH